MESVHTPRGNIVIPQRDQGVWVMVRGILGWIYPVRINKAESLYGVLTVKRYKQVFIQDLLYSHGRKGIEHKNLA